MARCTGMSAEPAAGAPPHDATPPSARRHRHRRRIAIWVGLGIALIAVLLWVRHATRRAAPTPPVPPVAVLAATAERGDLPVYIEAIGTVTALATASIASQVNGQIWRVRYTEGQLVHRGTPLIDVDPRPFQAALLQAEGALERDLQVLAQARMDLDRYRAAWAGNAIARQQVEDQVHLVRQTEGTVKNDRGLVAAARTQLAFCNITAPLAGRVGLRLVDPGNVVTAAGTTPLAVVTQTQPISVVFTVSEDDLGQLWSQPDHGTGAVVALFDRARTRQLAAGTLRTIDNQIDTTTGTVRVRAVFDNPDEALFPNQFVNTRVLVRTLRGVITLPSSAIQRDGQKTFVYAIDTGRAHVTPVTTGASADDRTQVEGIAPAARVANSSFEKLREGVPVAVVQQPPPGRQERARR